MGARLKNFFFSLLSEDMAKQAKWVEGLCLVVFIVMLLIGGWLWQYQLELTKMEDGKKVVVRQLNIFELLLSKKE